MQRWLKLVKYLREFGWEPIVYAPENPEYPEIDTTFIKDIPQGLKIIKQPIWEPYSYYKKLVGLKKQDKIGAGFLSENKKNGFAEKLSVWLRGNFFIPDARKFWIIPSVKYLTEYLIREPVDAIISTGPPHSMHLIALGVKKKTGVPWLADFCDPWTSIDFYNQLRLTKFADNKHHLLEKQVLQYADAVTPVTQTMSEEFGSLFPRKYEVVTNGFDEADIAPLLPEMLDRKFSLAHIGSLNLSRNPQILWDTLARMVNEDDQFASDLEIKLVGKVDITVLKSISDAGLTKFLRKISYLPHDQAILETQKSQVLLLLINRTPNAKGILTGKLFEYLASQRPILCLGPVDGDASFILEDTQSGKICDYEDEETLKQYITDYYDQFLNKQIHNSNKNLYKFSWRILAGEIAQILNSVTPRKKSG